MLTLKYSELRYLRLFEAAQEGILILDAATGRIKDVNPYLIKMLGYSHEEFVEKKLWEVGAFRDIEACQDAFEALQVNEYIRYDDLPLKTKEGTLIQVEFVSNVYSADDEAVIQCNIRDITARKKADAALRASEERYRQLLESLPDGVVVHSQGRVVFANRASASIIGAASPADLIGKPIIEFVHPDYRDLALKRIQRSLSDGVPLASVEEKFVRVDGTLIDAEVTATPFSYAGKPAMLAVFNDVTERNRTEEGLRKSEAGLEEAQRIAHVGSWEWVAETDTPSWSRELCTMLEVDADKPVPKLADQDQLYTADSMVRLNSAVEKTMQTGAPYEIELERVRKDGSHRWLFSRGERWFDETGQLIGLRGTALDITARKQAEVEISQRLSELEVLYESGLTLGQIVSPKAIAQQMIDLLDQKMDWHHTAVRLYHPESGTLELLAFNLPNLSSREETHAAEERFKNLERPDQGLSGWVVQHGTAVRTNDLKNDPRYFETFPGLHSGLYVPIKIAERVIGVISIETEGAHAYAESDERLVSTLATQAAIAIDNARLFDSLNRSNIDLASAYDATIEGWSRALDLRDKETEGHSQRVTDMTLRLAQTMGVSREELVHVRHGALLHDIGKMGVPDSILLKPDPLTEDEWKIMRKHPEFAYNLLSPIAYLKPALDIPYCHHEKWDGTGYPRGLKGGQIPLTARIFAVVDVWDALSSDRPYRPAWPEEKLREHICASSGTHFDPQVVEAFIKILVKVADPV